MNRPEYEVDKEYATWVSRLCKHLLIGLLVGALFWLLTSGREVKLYLSSDKSIGAQAAASRCPDCIQPGDHLTYSMHGRWLRTHGVRVYRGDDVVAACDDCDSVSLTVTCMGSYVVVGYELPSDQHAKVLGGGFDRDVAGLMERGASVVTTRFEAR